ILIITLETAGQLRNGCGLIAGRLEITDDLEGALRTPDIALRALNRRTHK
ncbi:MAG: hypothetical protein JWN96_498, partial [Mycobacterium sp.]|nr:hypothetical protein [Mycobacterium sp.]